MYAADDEGTTDQAPPPKGTSVTLEDLHEGALVRGVLPNQNVTVVARRWHGDSVVTLTFRDADGKVDEKLLYRHDEPSIEIVQDGRPWSFDADGAMLRLVSEAKRISLAHLFDPYLAIHTSDVEPLPHQITAVYETMLPRQPLRFLLADDPGAGKTIMAGLLIKELMLRGDLARCLVVCPGILVEQWQDELSRRFGVDFDILTRDMIEASATANPFEERDLLIARLDHLSRNEELQEKLDRTDWDLIVCDEAHKMSATYYGNELKRTKRYQLGQRLSKITRNFLLMTATPHNGKETDFQLFMALLDGDRFEGKFRDGIHVSDPSDMMRRMVKEQLLKFDGRPLFPERVAYTVKYELSDGEAQLYHDVTDYVTNEFNRADALENDRRKGTVGFALTILQRRLASSPEAIYQSLRRRRERLEERLREERLLKRGRDVRFEITDVPDLSDDDIEDLEDSPEVEDAEEQIVDRASTAQTIGELEAEIDILGRLEALAKQVRNSGVDRKWEEVSRLLQDNPWMFDEHGNRRKIVIFTEHRDTLSYLERKIRDLLGKDEAVVSIHGGLAREVRRNAQEAFTHQSDVQVLLATDAAGEGINLQRAHLMINYDLPWNPNRIEQRFGRIHRIGQTEVCHLWNLVAFETREGDVFNRLLEKLDQERETLGGKVFDVLGKLTFEGRPLRELLVEAIRYGNDPETRARLHRAVEGSVDAKHLTDLIEEHALAHDQMDASRVQKIREEMERAAARRLQPHYIASFFREAFEHLGGKLHEREPERWEVRHVPSNVRARGRLVGTREAVRPSYERIAFEKENVAVEGRPLAAFVCPGHPLLDATTDLILEQYRGLLKQGAILVDDNDAGTEPRLLYYLEHAIQEGRATRDGTRRLASKRMLFVELDQHGEAKIAGPAPYLDYRPLTSEERKALNPLPPGEGGSRSEPGEGSGRAGDALLDFTWTHGLESKAESHAIQHIVPQHFAEVRERKEAIVTKTMAAVKERLTKEIAHWYNREQTIRDQELAGRTPKLNSAKARQRAEHLESRLHERMQELEQERELSPLPPNIIGGALILPRGLLDQLAGREATAPPHHAKDQEAIREIERIAMEAVMRRERELGNEPRDVSKENLGYDIESREPARDGKPSRLRFIEVKGRAQGATTVTVTRNEVLCALNEPDNYILAIGIVEGSECDLRYVRRPFTKDVEFSMTTIEVNLRKLANVEIT